MWQEVEKTEEEKTAEVLQNISTNIAAIVRTDAVNEETKQAVEQAIANGETVTAAISVGTVLAEEIVDTTVKENTKKLADGVLGGNAKVVYLDISVILSGSTSGELGTLNKLQEEITITVPIPEEMKGDHTYLVIRNHKNTDGTIETAILNTVKNTDGTISFKTDRFSTYAVAYDAGETSDNDSESADDIVNTSNQDSVTLVSPKTGEAGVADVYWMCIICTLIVIGILKKSYVK